MNSGEHYRTKAAQFDAYAREEADPTLKKELFNLAASYRRLAEQADRNARTNVVYETPTQRVAQQQQQQPQAKPKDEK